MPPPSSIEIVRVGAVLPARLRLLREDLVRILRQPIWIDPGSLDLVSRAGGPSASSPALPATGDVAARSGDGFDALGGGGAAAARGSGAAAPGGSASAASSSGRAGGGDDSRNGPGNTPHGTLTPAFDPGRGQYRVEPLLEMLGRGAAPGRVRLGVTDVDLFLPVFTHVLGAAQLGGPAGIVSCHRLGGEGRGRGEQRLRERLLREALHELGHCFGLIHCRRSWCAMAPARSVEEVDLRDAAYCPECARRPGLPERESGS